MQKKKKNLVESSVFSWQVGQGQDFEEGDQIAIDSLSMQHIHEIRMRMMKDLVWVEI